MNDLLSESKEYSSILTSIYSSRNVKIPHIENIIQDEQNIQKSSLLANVLKIEDHQWTADPTDLENSFRAICSKYIKPNLQSNLRKSLGNFQLEKINNFKPNVGPVSSTEKMVESTYLADSKLKYQMAEQVCHIELITKKWREIGGDGNCFYRSVIFGYLENLILQREIQGLKHLVTRLDECFDPLYKNTANLPFLIKRSFTEIDRRLIINIIYNIIELLDSGDEKDSKQAHVNLLKAFNYSKSFDICMVLYLRYEIYEFLLENQDKLYSETFPVKLGNILPFQYETDDEKFLFDDFFKNELLKLYTYAEKIVIYVTPYVLKKNLRLLIYDHGADCNIQTKDFPCGVANKSQILVLYRKAHYDICYGNEYYNTWYEHLSCYEQKNEVLHVLDKVALEIYRDNYLSYVDLEKSKIFDTKEKKQKREDRLKEERLKEEAKKEKEKSESLEQRQSKRESKPGLKCISSEYDIISKNLLEKEIQDLRQKLKVNKPKNEKIEIEKIDKDNSSQCKSCLVPKLKVIQDYCEDCLIAAWKEFLMGKDSLESYYFKFSPINIEDIFNKFRSEFCVVCQARSPSSLMLACKCRVCKGNKLDCLAKMTNQLLENKFKCLCGEEQSASSIRNTSEVFQASGYSNLKIYTIQLMSEKFLSQCMFCLQGKTANEQFKSIRLKDAEISRYLNSKNFKHVICLDCCDIPVHLLECKLCGTIHSEA